jgi:hypothetical protein
VHERRGVERVIATPTVPVLAGEKAELVIQDCHDGIQSGGITVADGIEESRDRGLRVVHHGATSTVLPGSGRRLSRQSPSAPANGRPETVRQVVIAKITFASRTAEGKRVAGESVVFPT